MRASCWICNAPMIADADRETGEHVRQHGGLIRHRAKIIFEIEAHIGERPVKGRQLAADRGELLGEIVGEEIADMPRHGIQRAAVSADLPNPRPILAPWVHYGQRQAVTGFDTDAGAMEPARCGFMAARPDGDRRHLRSAGDAARWLAKKANGAE